MKLSIGSILNIAPSDGQWHVTFDIGLDAGPVVAPVVGWATVVTAHLNDDTVRTDPQAAFVWGDMVWTETELREHTPGLGSVSLRHNTIAATPTGLAKAMGHRTPEETAECASH